MPLSDSQQQVKVGKTSLELKTWAIEQVVMLHAQQLQTIDKVISEAEQLVQYVTGIRQHGRD